MLMLVNANNARPGSRFCSGRAPPPPPVRPYYLLVVAEWLVQTDVQSMVGLYGYEAPGDAFVHCLEGTWGVADVLGLSTGYSSSERGC